MASTYSDRLKLELMATGANVDSWGNVTNSNLEVVDAFNAGYLSKSVAGSADVTLTTANRDPSAESSNKVIEFTGELTGDIKVFVPAVENNYIFFNNTTGSFTLTVAPTGHASNGVAISQGAHTIQYCKGDRIIDLFASTLGNVRVINQLKIGTNIQLNSNGVVNATTFKGDGAGLTGVAEFPSGTEAMFVQTAAPTGFTTNTNSTLSECCLQVVNGTGGGTGGADTFSTVFNGSKTATGTDVPLSTSNLALSSNYSVGNTSLSNPTIPSHSHSNQNSGGGAPQARMSNVGPPTDTFLLGPFTASESTSSSGGGGSHSHSVSNPPISGSLATPISSSVPAMDLKFADSIIATKD
jgi:hypothetical protein